MEIDTVTFFIYTDSLGRHHRPAEVGSVRLALKGDPEKVVKWAGSVWGSRNLDRNEHVIGIDNRIELNRDFRASERQYCDTWTVLRFDDAQDVSRMFDDWIDKLGYVKVEQKYEKS